MSVEVTEADGTTWRAPFCATPADGLKCPKCGADESVRVRDLARYVNEDQCEAYCAECHSLLWVWVEVEVSFSDPEVAD
jgi:hypothetical protein